MPSHVDPSLRYRALLKGASLSLESSQQRSLGGRVLWVLQDLSQPGLRSALFARKLSVYQEVVRRLKRRL